MKQDTFTRLTSLLQSLEQAKIHSALQSCRDEAIMVLVTVPGERWEVEFLADGSVEVEQFISEGKIYGEDTQCATLHEVIHWTNQRVQ
jgi:hypothetical protein